MTIYNWKQIYGVIYKIKTDRKKREIGVWIFLLSIFIIIAMMFIVSRDCRGICQANYSILSLIILAIGFLLWGYCNDKEKEMIK